MVWVSVLKNSIEWPTINPCRVLNFITCTIINANVLTYGFVNTEQKEMRYDTLRQWPVQWHHFPWCINLMMVVIHKKLSHVKYEVKFNAGTVSHMKWWLSNMNNVLYYTQCGLFMCRYARDLHNFKVQRKLCASDYYQSHSVPLVWPLLLLRSSCFASLSALFLSSTL